MADKEKPTQEWVNAHIGEATDETKRKILQQGYTLPAGVAPPTASPTLAPAQPSTYPETFPRSGPTGTLAPAPVKLQMPPGAPQLPPDVLAGKTPLSPEQLLEQTGVGQEFKGLTRDHLLQMAEGFGLDTVLTYGGGAVGGAVGGYFGGQPGAEIGTTLGMTGGSLASRGIKKLTGIEQPGTAGDVLAALPAVGLVRPALKTALRYGTTAGKIGRAMEQTESVIGEAQALPRATTAEGGFRPDVPSRMLYQDFTAVHGAKQPGLSPARAVANEVYLEAGPISPAVPPRPLVPPGGITRKRVPPARIDMLANDIAQFPEGTTVETIHDYMKAVGPLTRIKDPAQWQTRQWADRLYAGLAQTLETTPDAAADLATANAAYRQEASLRHLGRVVSRATRPAPDGQPRINPQPMLNWWHDLSRPELEPYEKLIRGSFTADEWGRLGRRISMLAESVPRTSLEMGTFPYRRLETALVGGAAGATTGAVTHSPAAYALGVAGAGLALYDAANYGISKLLLMPDADPMIRRLIMPNGGIDPRAMALFNAAYQQERQREQVELPTMPNFVLPQAVQDWILPPRPEGQ